MKVYIKVKFDEINYDLIMDDNNTFRYGLKVKIRTKNLLFKKHVSFK